MSQTKIKKKVQEFEDFFCPKTDWNSLFGS